MAHEKIWILILVAVVFEVVTAEQESAQLFYNSPIGPYGQMQPTPFQYQFNPFMRYMAPHPLVRSVPYSAIPLLVDIQRLAQLLPKNQSAEKENPFVESPVLQASSTLVRIISGSMVSIGELPGYVVFVDVSTPICGGTLITSKHVLTSGKCADFIQTDQTNVRAYINTVQIAPLDSGTAIRSISSIVVNPNYGPGPSNIVLQNDIAVVTLDNPVVGVRRVRLAGFYDNFVGDTLVEYGFGYSGQRLLAEQSTHGTPTSARQNSPSNVLRKGTGQVISNSDCATLLGAPEVNDIQYMCITTNNPTCQGDVGSPLMKNGVQYGTSSWIVNTCTAGYPSVYMRVRTFKDWIVSVVDV